jgi:hypothetical protein
MRKKSIAFFALALLCSYYAADAQYRQVNYFSDSIRVEFPEYKSYVIFETRRFKKDDEFMRTFASRLAVILTHLKKALPSDVQNMEPKRIDITIKSEHEKQTSSGSVGVSYQPENEKMEFTITDKIPETKLIVRKNMIEQLVPSGWEIYIRSKDVRVTLYAFQFDGIENLAKQDYTNIITSLKADPEMQKLGKSAIFSRSIVKAGKVDQQVVNHFYPGDMLFLSAHAGVGLLRDKFYPELSASLGIIFTDHFNRKNHRLELIYNNMFFAGSTAEGGYSVEVNSFLSLGYSKNFSNSNRPIWNTVGAGLLINKQGDYFKGKTAKFFISSDIGSTKLNIVPEFYLTDDFKKFAFGLKLNYTF